MNRDPFKAISVPGTVQTELKARADMSQLLKWTAKRVPWIHIMSMAEGCSANYSPLGKGSGNVFELYGSTSSTALYDTTSKFPLPVVTGIDVGSLGNLGTTRKATIKLKAYTDEQLVELQKCYFIPGMDVRCQFGWNESCTGLAPPGIYTATDGLRQKALCEIASLAQKSPSYDGFQGVVAGFSYNLQTDNSWECSIEINSAAEAFADGTIEDLQCGCAREVTQTDAEGNEKDTVVKYGRLYTMLYDIFKDSTTGFQYYAKLGTSEVPVGLKEYLGVHDEFYWGMARTQDGKDDSSMLEGTWINDYDTVESYITWGMLEAAINKYTIPNTAGLPYGQIDSSGISLPKPNNLMSSDPRVCIIPGQQSLTQSRGGIGSDVDHESGISLCSIRLNIIFLMMELKKTFDGDKKMSTFVRAIIDKVNDVCGNPWNIEVVCTSDTQVSCDAGDSGGGTISIIDHKSFKKSDATIFEVKAKPESSAVRNISLEMKLTGAMKTQALYAGGTQQGGSSSKNDGDATGCKGLSFEPFYIGSGKNKAMPEAIPQEVIDAKCDCDEIDTPAKKSPPTKSELIEQCKDSISDSTCQALRAEIVKEMVGEAKPPHCAGVMLPFDFSFECDGIGGFRFSQLISCDRIPLALRNKLIWQITKVDHSITANDWTTKVGTVCRLKEL